MKLEYRKLSDEEVAAELATVPGWVVNGDLLSRGFEFPTYLRGADFVAAVARLAEALDHHPRVVLDYGKVRVEVNTHSVHGLSPYDFELARRIDAQLST